MTTSKGFRVCFLKLFLLSLMSRILYLMQLFFELGREILHVVLLNFACPGPSEPQGGLWEARGVSSGLGLRGSHNTPPIPW